MSLVEISNLEYVAINKKFGTVFFNGIRLYITADKQYFNATKFTKELNRNTKSASSGASNARWLQLLQNEASKLEFIHIDGKGTQEYKGWYAKIHLLLPIAISINPVTGYNWYNGLQWEENASKGYIYLVQPISCKGTNIYKVGKTNNMDKRLNTYGKGTKVFNLVAVTNTSKAESAIKQQFKDCGAINRTDIGSEYFEVESWVEAQEIFTEGSPLWDYVDPEVKDNYRSFNLGEWIHGKCKPEPKLDDIDDFLDDDDDELVDESAELI